MLAGPNIAAGKRVKDNVALFDLGPTILDWAGLEIPDWMEAESLTPYFGNGPTPQRTRVYAEHSNDALLTGTRLMTMVLEGSKKLIHFVDSDQGMLFDLEKDPQELNNLWNNPDHKSMRDDLIQDILHWRSESSLKTQGFIEACVRGAQSMMSPPLHIARGQHPKGSR